MGRRLAADLAPSATTGGLAHTSAATACADARLDSLARARPLAVALAAAPRWCRLRRHGRPSGVLRAGPARAPAATAPQRTAEPAWHRRQRRSRGAARALLRVAAAAELLSHHHSAQRPMGGRGGGGAPGGGKGARAGGHQNGGAGGVLTVGDGLPSAPGDMGQLLQELRHQSQQQQRILQALCGSGQRQQQQQQQQYARARSPSLGAGGGGPPPTFRRQSQTQPRDGDWACTACSFFPNFAKRRRCLQCGRAKAGAPAAREGTLTAGPVGAGGLRPQLAWGASRLGACDAAPTHRVPGSSAAAPPARRPGAPCPAVTSSSSVSMGTARVGSGAAGSSGRDASSATPARKATAPRCDEDGFVEVVHNASRRRRAKGEEEEGPNTRGWEAGQDGDPSMHAAGPGDGDNVEDMWQCAADASSQLGDDEDEDEEERRASEEDPNVLRNRLEDEQSMVRTLIREGVDSSHPAMVAAVAARDAAEEAWRATRRPHPVARRMGWAQQALDRAMRSRDKVRDELADFDTRTKEQRRHIEERLGQAMERVSKRRQALEELQEEAALDAPGYKKGKGTSEVCSQLAGGMRQSIAPQVAALEATLEDGSEAKQQFNLLVAQLEGLQGKLDLHAHGGNHGHEEFDIADEADEQSGTDWSESHDLQRPEAHGGKTGGADQGERSGLHRWTSKGHGRWDKDGNGRTRRTGKGNGHIADTPAATAPAAMDTDASGDQVTAMAAGAAQPGPGAGGSGRGRGGRDDESAQPPNKQHKGQTSSTPSGARGSADDDSRALELMQAQQGAAAAGEFGSPAAMHAAAQLHSRNVDRVTRAAIEQGVQPITDAGEELIVLGPQELEQWANAKLDRAKSQWW